MSGQHTQVHAEATGNGIHIGMRCLATTHMEPREQRQVDARRLAACWNACEGIETYALELMTGPLALAEQIKATGNDNRKPTAKAVTYRKQRDELLAALKELADIVQHALDQRSLDDMDSFTLQPAQAAIAKAESGQ